MRRLLMFVIALLIVLPVGAQGRLVAPDIARLAGRAPSDVVAFAALRMDDAYFAQTDALLAKLGMGRQTTSDLLEDLLGPDINDMRETWLGSTLAFFLLDAGLLLDDDTSGLGLLAEVRDRAAAEAYLLDDLNARRGITFNGRTAYTASGDSFFVLDETVLYFSQNATAARRWQDDEYLPLASSEGFVAALSGLQVPSYDFLVYADLRALLVEAVEANVRNMGQLERQIAVAAGMAAGHLAAAGVNGSNEALLVDITWTPGDTALLSEMGIDIEALLASQPVGLELAGRISANAQFTILANGLGASITAVLDAVELFGGMAAQDPDFARAMGLNGANPGGLIRGSLGLGFAALTGLNLENDVLAGLRGPFAMTLSAREGTDRSLPVLIDIGILAADPDGQAGRWQASLRDSLFAMGYSPIPTRGGGILELSPVLDEFLYRVTPELVGNPHLTPMLGGDGQIVVLGLRDTVEEALRGVSPSLRETAGLAAATDGLWLSGAQVIAHINGDALQAFPDRDMQQLGALALSLTASARWDGEQVQARLVIDLR